MKTLHVDTQDPAKLAALLKIAGRALTDIANGSADDYDDLCQLARGALAVMAQLDGARIAED